MTSTTNLMPCPFCGNGGIAVKNESPKDNSGGYFIECPGCGASTSLRYSCGDDPTPWLTEQWNRRSPGAAAQEPYAVLVREIGESSFFDGKPVRPGSDAHRAAAQNPEMDYVLLYSKPAAPQAALAAVSVGSKLVPESPTEEMLAAGYDAFGVAGCYAAMLAAAPAHPAEGAPSRAVYAEARECTHCQHVGINDSADGVATCIACQWIGDSPKEDKCPDCEAEGTMTASCPKCHQEYRLLAATPAAPAAGVLPEPDFIQRHEDVCGDEVGPSVGHYSADRVRALLAPPPSATTPDALTPAASDVLAERARQQQAEGYEPEADDEYVKGELASASATYALLASGAEGWRVTDHWPWAEASLRVADLRRMAVKSGALILAEIERIDRAQNREQHAFEDWMKRERPSGDTESVQRQWIESSDYADLQDRAAQAAAKGG